jgi:hypothetical protein
MEFGKPKHSASDRAPLALLVSMASVARFIGIHDRVGFLNFPLGM